VAAGAADGADEADEVLRKMQAKYRSSADPAPPPQASVPGMADGAEEETSGPEDANALGAMAMEAMLAGDMARYEALNRRLERKQAKISESSGTGGGASGASAPAIRGRDCENTKVLEEVDAAGRSRALVESVQSTSVKTKGRNKRGNANAVPGKEGGGYYEDDNVSLDDLLRRERIEGVQDYDANITDHILKKGAKFKMLDEDEDEAYALGWYESGSKKMEAHARDEKRQRMEVRDKQRIQMNLERCTFCRDSKRFGRRDAVISTAQHTYLCMDGFKECVLPGQVFIAPLQHSSAITDVDEEVWTEVRNYQKCLVRFFEKQEPPRAVLFAESVVTKVSREKAILGAGSHTCVVAYPIELALLQEARAFWHKALDEVESEFESQHKRVIKTDPRTGVRGSVPKGFPYVHIDFALTGGFAHVVEDMQGFAPHFVQQTMAGMCELTILDRAYTDREQYRDACQDFKKRFSDGFDWAQALGS